MTPHEDPKTLHEIMLRLRNLAHYRHEKVKDISPPKRDKQGFRKRRPKLAVAAGLGVAAVLAALVRLIVKNVDRG